MDHGPADGATIPGATVYVIDRFGPDGLVKQAHRASTNSRLRNGRIIRDGAHSTLTEMRLRESANPQWTDR